MPPVALCVSLLYKCEKSGGAWMSSGMPDPEHWSTGKDNT